ncbi:26753_t:CDS:2, partial [Racocetra persica]
SELPLKKLSNKKQFDLGRNNRNAKDEKRKFVVIYNVDVDGVRYENVISEAYKKG